MQSGRLLGYAAGAALLQLVATPVAAQTEIELWLGGEPGTVNVFTELADAYMAEHPDVTINTTFVGSDLFNPTLVPALSAGEGPDVFQFGTGPGQPAAVIVSGLVLDLTSYYFDLGWDKVIPETVVSTTSSDGKLWAVGDAVETTVMFYNKDIFAELGLEIPTDWAAFEAVVAALKEAGFDTPIGLGGADKWPISHWQSMLFGRFAVSLQDGRLQATAWGEAVDPARHAPAVEIKGATYTDLAVRQDDEGGWTAQCVVDVLSLIHI